MKQIRMIILLLLVLSLSSCASVGQALMTIGTGAGVGTLILGVASYAEGKETRKKELQALNAQHEILCTTQLVGALEWPSICPANLSKMDACSRISFNSRLCDKYAKIYTARYETQQASSQLAQYQSETVSVTEQNEKPKKKVTKKKSKQKKIERPAQKKNAVVAAKPVLWED